ncbi:unnamed protein product [Owenia fusiformis]|uniref:Glycosyltransferase family 92 protein n=1 Tax=Owenia fusiformis TaxID=6347 RepID=A0A8S4PH97_OWEFU|nr:unnamed protein product [Owenia fusiformis]
MTQLIGRTGGRKVSWNTILMLCIVGLLVYRHFKMAHQSSSLVKKGISIDNLKKTKLPDDVEAAVIVEDDEHERDKVEDDHNNVISDNNVDDVQDHDTNEDPNRNVSAEMAKSEGTYTFEEKSSIKWPSAVSWQRTNDSIEIYILSAFYDDRPTLGSKAAVQVLSITEEPQVGVPAFGDIYCHLWGISEKPLVVKAERILLGVEKLKRPIKFHNKAFRSFIWSCELNRNTKIPMFVSISFRTKTATSFMPVQAPAKPKVKNDFAVCQRYFGRVDPYIIIEMMELYKILGVSKAIIYITNLSPETSKVLQHYSQEGFMELVDFPTPFESFPRFPPMHKPNHIRILQPHSYNDCIYRNMYKYKYILVTDPDEIIIPLLHQTLPDMMAAIKQTKGFEDYRTFIFRNIFFFSHFPQTESESPKVTTLRFQRHLAPGNPFPAVLKAIVEPMACLGFHVHHCWKITPLAQKDMIMSKNVGLSFHYRKCHFELEQQGKCKQFLDEMIIDNTMTRFKDSLIPAIKRQVKALGMSPID